MNIVVHALSHIHEVNMLSFSMIFLSALRKYLYDSFVEYIGWELIMFDISLKSPYRGRQTLTFWTFYSIGMGRSLFQSPSNKKENFECHEYTSSTRHLGIHRMFGLISTNFFWPKLHHHVQNYVIKYLQC